MDTITVKMTHAEILNAGILGCFRFVQSHKNGSDKYGANSKKDGWQISIMSAVAESAWAKHINKYWNAAIGNYDASDVDEFYEVRSTSIVNREKGHLIMHPEDKDDKPYILAFVAVIEVVFVGWLWGREGKKDEYWGDKMNNGRPAFWITQDRLRPMSALMEIEKGRSHDHN